jgi:hypothetical protein
MHDDRITSFVLRGKLRPAGERARSLARGNFYNYPLLSLSRWLAESRRCRAVAHRLIRLIMWNTHTHSHITYTLLVHPRLLIPPAPVAAKTCYFAAGLNLMRPGLYMYGMNLLHPHCGFEQFIARATARMYVYLTSSCIRVLRFDQVETAPSATFIELAKVNYGTLDF